MFADGKVSFFFAWVHESMEDSQELSSGIAVHVMQLNVSGCIQAEGTAASSGPADCGMSAVLWTDGVPNNVQEPTHVRVLLYDDR